MNIFDPKNNNLNWRDYAKIFRKKKWYFIGSVIFVISLGALKALTSDPLYESSCMIQIRPSNLLSRQIERMTPGVLNPERITAAKKQIKSTDFLLKLVYQLELHKTPAMIERLHGFRQDNPDRSAEEVIDAVILTKLRQQIQVKILSRDVLSIEAQAKTPERAYELVKTLSDIFIEESLKEEMSIVQSALNFNNEQVEVFKKKLDESEQKLEAYRKKNIFQSVDNDVNNEAIARIREALVAVDFTIKESKSLLNLKSVSSKNGKRVESIALSELKSFQAQIDEQIDLMADLTTRYNWSSPQVVKVNRRIVQLGTLVKKEIKRKLSEEYTNADHDFLHFNLQQEYALVDLEIQNRKKDRLSKVIAKYRNTASEHPGTELTLRKLEEEVDVNRRIYNMFVEQNQGTQIEEAIQQADAAGRFKMLETPREQLLPVTAGARMILLMSGIAGLFVGIGAVYVSELLDKSIRTIGEAENLFNIPVIGVLPELASVESGPEVESEKIKGNKKALFAVVAGILLVVVGVLVFSKQMPAAFDSLVKQYAKLF